MKEATTRFTCDWCNKIITDCQEFPYHEGWIYLYEINFQRNRKDAVQLFDKCAGDVARIQEHDKHFCCQDCFIEFLEGEVVKKKKVKKK